MKKVFVFLLGLGLPAFSSDVFNVGLRVNLEYSDLYNHCKLSALVEPYRLSAELNEGKVTRALLRKSARFQTEKTIELTEAENQSLEIREEANQMWIKQLFVSPELLKALLFSGEGFGSDTCVPPAGIDTVFPEQVTFDFGVESVGYLLPHLITSQEVILRGKTQENTSFRIRLSLTQDRR